MKFDFEYECDKGWDEMKGGDRRRFCDSCDKHVHHISGMTEDQARKFLEEHNYEVCVDFYRDEDGHTKFRDAAKKLRLQNDGIKQLLASAAAIVPLAIAAAFVDFDKPVANAAPAVVSSADPTPSLTEPSPINLDGTEPVVAPPAIEPAVVRPPVVEPPVVEPTVVDPAEPWMVEPDTVDTPEPPTPVQPFVHTVDEPKPAPDSVDEQPDAKPRPHVRGRVRRPADWDRDTWDRDKKQPLPTKDFQF